MKEKQLIKNLKLICLGVAGFLVFSCAEKRPARDYTQANVVKKSIFNPDAEWYFRQLVVRVTPNTPGLFVGAQTRLERIRWKIEEKQLLAYRSYEDFEGSGDLDDKEGALVAAFTIESHFDIEKAYSSSTGETQNILQENTTDRPWYQREYMRVDWSTNHAAKVNIFSVDLSSVSPVRYYIQDPNDPDAPEITENYVDVVTRYTIRPSPTLCEMFRTSRCGEGIIDVRNSFLKIDPKHEYEPLDFPDTRKIYDKDGRVVYNRLGTPARIPYFDKFGFFRTERAKYDRKQGVTWEEISYYINRFNIWKRWWQRDEFGNLILDENGNKIPLPYNEREVKPIIYYMSPTTPEPLKETYYQVGWDWDEAFRETVASLRILERKPELKKRGVSQAEVEKEMEEMIKGCGHTKEKMEEKGLRCERVFIVCDNPGKPDDPGYKEGICEKPGVLKRLGDLRYNFVWWVDEFQLTSPLGYGPSSKDPLTGEIISGHGFIYGARVDRIAGSGKEIIQLINGELDPAEFIEGVNVEDYMKDLYGGRKYISMLGDLNYHRKRIQDMINIRNLQKKIDELFPRPDSEFEAQRMWEKFMRHPEEFFPPHIYQSSLDSSRQDLFDLIKGTWIEDLLITPEIKLAFGFDPFKPLSAEERDQLSLKELFAPEEYLKKERERDLFLAKHAIDMPEMIDSIMIDEDLYGLALKLKGKKSEEIWNALRKAIVRAVVAEEIGHSIGLRHNFSGSTDALNYPDEYWELRTKECTFPSPYHKSEKYFECDCPPPGEEGKCCPEGYICLDFFNQGKYCVKEGEDKVEFCKFKDPMREVERERGLREYQYTSVMDYEGNLFIGETHGIGKYDVAAIKFGYGGLVEVFEHGPVDPLLEYKRDDSGEPRYTLARLTGAERSKWLPWYPVPAMRHYTRIPWLFRCDPTHPCPELEPEIECNPEAQDPFDGKTCDSFKKYGFSEPEKKPNEETKGSLKCNNGKIDFSACIWDGCKDGHCIRNIGLRRNIEYKYLVEEMEDLAFKREQALECTPKIQGLKNIIGIEYNKTNILKEIDRIIQEIKDGRTRCKAKGRFEDLKKKVKANGFTSAEKINKELDEWIDELKEEAGKRESLWEVPYKFCPDEWAGTMAGCLRWDLGADEYEVTQREIRRYEGYYLFRNFPRGTTARPSSIFQGYTSRLFRRFSTFISMYRQWMYRLWTRWEWEEFSPDPTQPWVFSLDGGLGATQAVLDGMSFLRNILAMPEPGSHYYDPEDGLYHHFAYSEAPQELNRDYFKDPVRLCNEGETSRDRGYMCADLNIPFGVGKEKYSRFDIEAGYMYPYKVYQIGTFWDKYVAMIILTYSFTFLGQGFMDSFSGLGFSPYYLIFPSVLQNIFGGMITDQYERYAGLVCKIDGKAQYYPREIFVDEETIRERIKDIESCPEPLYIDSEATFTDKLYAILFSMRSFRGWYEETYRYSIKISCKGCPFEDYEEPSGGTVAEFLDPFSNRVYKAVRNEGVAISVGYELVRKANELRQEYDINENRAQEIAEELPPELSSVVADMPLVNLSSHILEEIGRKGYQSEKERLEELQEAQIKLAQRLKELKELMDLIRGVYYFLYGII